MATKSETEQVKTDVRLDKLEQRIEQLENEMRYLKQATGQTTGDPDRWK